MRAKLDENLGRACAALLDRGGLEVTTVAEERLCGADDATVIGAARREGQCLVTIDLDFANPLLFRPSEYAGIAVLRLPRRPSHADLVDAARTLLRGLSRESIHGKLWIVHRGRIREYQEEEGLGNE